MQDVKFRIVQSGSKGNAVILNDTVLIDCGVTFKALAPFIAPLKIVLLTHVHGDHFHAKTVERLAKERPTLRFACGNWLVNDLLAAGVNPRNIDIMESAAAYQYPKFTIEPFSLLHDVPNMGYKVRFYDGGRAFYATDAGNLEGITAKKYDLYLIEGNYDEDEIIGRIREKEDEGKYVHEYRALKYHLSKTQCVEFFEQNAGPNSKFVYLHEHSSEVN